MASGASAPWAESTTVYSMESVPSRCIAARAQLGAWGTLVASRRRCGVHAHHVLCALAGVHARARQHEGASTRESPPRASDQRRALSSLPPPFPLLHTASSPCPCGAAAGRPAAELPSARSAAPVRRSVHCSAARARARASSHLAARTSYSTRSGHGARPGRARVRGGTGRSRPQSFRTYMPLARNICARAGNRRTSNSTCLLAETAAAAVAAFF